MLWIAIRSTGPALRSLWGIGVIAVFIHCLVDYPLQRPALAGFFFVFLGVIESAKKNVDFVSESIDLPPVVLRVPRPPRSAFLD